MLITDLEYFDRSANYTAKTSGMDHPKKCGSSVEEWHNYPVQNFNYEFNSWGFRGPEYDQYVGKKVNICLGDSFTVNLGGPIEHSWCSQLAEYFDIPTLNLGMDGAGNDAIKLVYERASKVFDVQNCFVMYSYLHRRLVNKKFEWLVAEDLENFKHFFERRIPNAIECALPYWNWSDEERKFLSSLEIYFFNKPLYFLDHQTIDRKFIDIKTYNVLRGASWPTLEEFVKGAEPHPDMLTKEFGHFISSSIYKNRDGHHMSQETNKLYADYLYNQWKQRNES